MSKELKFEFNDYIIAIDEPYENDCGYVAIGKKDTKDNINIWFKSLNQQTVDFYIELQKYIADLEAKLAESERQYQEYRQVVEKDIKKEIDERMRDTIKEFNLDISQLKQQLAEKEKEIENIKLCRCVNCTNEYEFMLEGLVEDLERELDKCDQDKISFALEQLEKVKEIFIQNVDAMGVEYRDDYFMLSLGWVKKVIDNQIKQLKEMK